MGDVLIRANDDERAPLAVDPAQIEDVAGPRVGGERLLVVDEPVGAFAREQQRRQLRKGEVAVALLEDRAEIEHAVDVGSGGRVPS